MEHRSGTRPLTGMARLCSILRVMTTIRVCQPSGEVLWRFTQPPAAAPARVRSLVCRRRRAAPATPPLLVVTGQRSVCTPDNNVRALDTGCVWGKALTAWRMEDDAIFTEAAHDGAALGD